MLCRVVRVIDVTISSVFGLLVLMMLMMLMLMMLMVMMMMLVSMRCIVTPILQLYHLKKREVMLEEKTKEGTTGK